MSSSSLVAVETLLDRLKRLRLPLKTVAGEAGLNHHTLYRLPQRSDRVQARTLRRLEKVVEGYERSELMRLLRLHGDWLHTPEGEAQQINDIAAEAAGLGQQQGQAA